MNGPAPRTILHSYCNTRIILTEQQLRTVRVRVWILAYCTSIVYRYRTIRVLGRWRAELIARTVGRTLASTVIVRAREVQGLVGDTQCLDSSGEAETRETGP